MREIKFRGKTVSGEWVYGNLNVLKQKSHNIEPGTYISNDAGMPFAYQVIPETVGQFVGIYDTTNAEIYDGDVCHDEHIKVTGVVTWIQRNSMFRLTVDAGRYGLSMDVAPDHCVVLGSIHDNAYEVRTND